MSVKIRLKRLGRKKRPFYRVVVMDSRTRRDGREIEKLGWFDPLKGKEAAQLNEDRTVYWLEQGAQPSDTVASILKRTGINYRLHLMKMGKSEEEIAEELSRWKAEKLTQTVSAPEVSSPAPEVEVNEVKESEPEAEGTEEAETDVITADGSDDDSLEKNSENDVSDTEESRSE